MSNFDREASGGGRGVHDNFREKANGEGAQSLFRLNKMGPEPDLSPCDLGDGKKSLSKTNNVPGTVRPEKFKVLFYRCRKWQR